MQFSLTNKDEVKYMAKPDVKLSEDVGIIFNIQRFSIHDGPGIRTTVFLKGCSLDCKWCSNPEGIKLVPEIILSDTKCIKCGKCVEVCPKEAISLVDDIRRIDWSRCNLCLECAQVCPSGAIEQVGKYVSKENLMEEIQKDVLFYQNSGGGVTFSGGEPLVQWEFVREVGTLCKEKAIHTTLDTTGNVEWHKMDSVLDYIDLVLYDIKHLDPAMHKEATGIGNAVILDNVVKTARKARIWLRIPLIPGYNDSESYAEELAKFSAELPIEKISLLPYHEWGAQKYKKLGKSYSLEGTSPPTDEHMQRLKDIIESHGLTTTIGR